ncbi:MAG: sulfatase [Rhodospirillales bacterium]|nr:sulfatase [Rhodospirillales bacterium]
MRTVFLLFDSLNRRALECYGGTAIATPNFRRLAERCVVFDSHYVGSLPCIPARRDMHTGRINFLHNQWGPLEPFDDSAPRILEQNGVYSHLITDHYHYFEDGGVCYHGRYSSFEFVRGQEKDKWKGLVDLPVEKWRGSIHEMRFADRRDVELNAVNLVNREYIRDEADFPTVKNTEQAIEFFETNKDADNWLLQVEYYDPHEPFIAPARFREGLATEYDGPILDWPRYRRVCESDDEVAEIRANYLASVRMVDHYLGKLLDTMDRLDMWKDTAIVLTADHGFLLGEHDWWGKNRMPCFDEICRIPMMFYHPDFAGQGGTRRQALTQTVDVMPTLLALNGVAPPPDVQGHDLRRVLAEDKPVREACLYGMFGAAVNVTDGRYTYFRYPTASDGHDLYQYTVMPTHMRTLYDPKEFDGTVMAGPFRFTKGMQVMRIPANVNSEGSPMKGQTIEDARTVLYDLENDPGQKTPIDDPATEARLVDLMIRLMREADAPGETFRRFGLSVPDDISVGR